MTNPRILYVPIVAAFEAEMFAGLAEWAEVQSFDAPGVGSTSSVGPGGIDSIVATGIGRLDELGWDSCCVVCDSHAQLTAIELALREPRVRAICIGHAAARYSISGERPALTPAMHAAAHQLLDTDYRSFARAVTQMTQGQMPDDYVDRWSETVPQPVVRELLRELADDQPDLVLRLRGTDLPVVLGHHKDCVLWTAEGFEDAVAAVPAARVVNCEEIPQRDPGFIEAVRSVSNG